MRTVISPMVVWLLTASFAMVASAQTVKRTWTFDDEATGRIATGFTNEVGEWTVVASDRGKALAQSANNPNSVFNITLISDTNAKDVDLSVRMKPIAGQTDQGGGLVWRAKDKKNYYLARYNPLEDNFRLYKVVHGKRTLIQNYDIQHADGWHTLRVVMKGDQIECYYDGKKYLEARDSTFTQGGMIGLWSKADAQSHFDDLTLAKP
ncbi:MAG TPA: hypothetical protein VKP69_02820 [Isosphaeraceae bacterium]|nr:hypothetical protein [Isosphaeraceae bacterium]